MKRHAIPLACLLAALPAWAAAQTDPAREALRARIDFPNSRILLAPRIDAAGARPFDADRFLAALHAVAGTSTFQEATPPPPPTGTPPPDGVEAEDPYRRAFDFAERPGDATCGVLRGRTERHDVAIRLHDLDLLVRDRGAYRRDLADSLPDAAFLATARRLLDALGAAPAERASFDAKTLAAASRSETAGAVPSPAVDLGKKVYFQRVLGDVEVAGQKLVFSFQLDGALRKLRGRWTPIDYGRSQLRSTLTPSQFVERALDAMVAAKVPTDSTLPIFLFTYFRPGQGIDPCGAVPVDLRGLAIVELRGPDGGNRLGQYDFDI